MKLEDTIAKSLHDYPSLYKDTTWEKSRLKVLDHLFLVNGNGYEWYDGYLVDKHDNTSSKKKLPKYGKQKYTWRPDDSWFSTKLYRDYNWSPEILEVIKNDEKFKDLAFIEEASGYTAKPYPVSEYSAICTAPDNIRPDWLAGAIEAAEWAKNFYSGPPAQVMTAGFIQESGISEKSVKNHIDKRLELTCKALTRLKALEPKLKTT
jgi:hypothetical protein